MTEAHGRGGQRVLVVEDDRAISDLMHAVLTGMGLSTDIAHDGPKALELAETNRPALVVLDLGLPKMYGKNVGVRLRKRYQGLPVMVVSALPSSAVAQDAWEIGAFAYITKPFELDAFTAAVQRGLKLASRAGSTSA
jgi:DNA-binding response OmpR family regulator